MLYRLRSMSGSRTPMLGLSVFLVSVLVVLEWHYDFDFSLGILYILPVMLAATILRRWQIVLAAIFCAYTRGIFTPQETHLEHILRFCMATAAYSACGLLIYQIADSRRSVLTHYIRLRYEQQLRRRAQEQLRLLAESSPAAILTVASTGKIVAANRAAETMLNSDRPLIGQAVRDFAPLFDDALKLPAGIGHISTSATAWARRADGTLFPAATWFSIYGTGERRHLAAILVDTSNEVREREQAQFELLASHDRILAGAVSHEIRNLCSAISVVASNLERNNPVAADPDFVALRNLVAGLKDLASLDLRKRTRSHRVSVHLQDLTEELRVIIGQDWQDIDGEFNWQVPPEFPPVQADRQGLLQALLNLSQNSLRAVEHCDMRSLTIDTTLEAERVILRICDTGSGIDSTEHLFQPFRPGADGSGLGLYVSRALIQSFGGELRFVPTTTGCCFEIAMLPAAEQL